MARHFACDLLGISKADLFLRLDEELSHDAANAVKKAAKDFAKGLPYAYITGLCSFYGMDFYAQKGVLIAREDSEVLLNAILEHSTLVSGAKALEIGFGSGVLSIVLALKLKLNITACDINALALKLAQKNAAKHEITGISWQLGSYLDMDFRGFDLVFSNPPYVANHYPIDIWVQNEPKEALFSGEKGLDDLEKIIEKAAKEGVRFLACEFGYDQKEELEQMLAFWGFGSIFYKDLSGFDRAFFAIKKS